MKTPRKKLSSEDKKQKKEATKKRIKYLQRLLMMSVGDFTEEEIDFYLAEPVKIKRERRNKKKLE